MTNLEIKFEQLTILDLLRLVFLDFKTYVIIASIVMCYLLILSAIINNRYFIKRNKMIFHLLFSILTIVAILVQCDNYSDYRKISYIKGSSHIFKAISLSSDYQKVWFRDKNGDAYEIKLDTEQGEVKQEGDKIKFDNFKNKSQHVISDDNDLGSSDLYNAKIVYKQ